MNKSVGKVYRVIVIVGSLVYTQDLCYKSKCSRYNCRRMLFGLQHGFLPFPRVKVFVIDGAGLLCQLFA